MIGGLSFTIVPVIFENYLPHALSQVPVAMFGLIAVLVARNPHGMGELHVRQFRWIYAQLQRFNKPEREPDSIESVTPRHGN
jgi:hypothetical protein